MLKFWVGGFVVLENYHVVHFPHRQQGFTDPAWTSEGILDMRKNFFTEGVVKIGMDWPER